MSPEIRSVTVALPMPPPQHLNTACVLLEKKICLRGCGKEIKELEILSFFRSLQQLSECTDGLGADIGTQLERVNEHCVTGFPDVHMMLIMTELNGTLEAETINPESEEKKECRVEVEDSTRVRMTEYLSDYFTDETYLTDALALGPTATNIGVTPAMQFYGGGLYYNPEECRVS